MKAAIAVSILALAGCAAVTETQTSATPKEMKVAFDITTGNPQAVIKTLETIDVTRKQLIANGVTPHIVVGFRGDASYFTQTNLAAVKEENRADAIKVASAIRQLRAASGVESLEQCNLPLEPRKLKAGDLMPEVKLVPNGWISLANYQHKGYAYIAP